MGSSPSSIVTLQTHRRAWWMWRLIAWARWLHRLTARLVALLEG